METAAGGWGDGVPPCPADRSDGGSSLSTIRDSAVARASHARVLAYFFLAGSGLGFLLLAFLPAAVRTNRLAEAGLLTLAAVLGAGILATADRVPDWLIA